MWLGAELVVLVLGAWIAWRGRQAPELQVTTARVSTGPIVRRIIERLYGLQATGPVSGGAHD